MKNLTKFLFFITAPGKSIMANNHTPNSSLFHFHSILRLVLSWNRAVHSCMQ